MTNKEVRCDVLTLGRYVGESVTIGPNVVVTVVDIRYGQVKLAIQAPREVPIWREELREKLLKDGRLIEVESGWGRNAVNGDRDECKEGGGECRR